MNPAREEARPSRNGARRRPRQYEAPIRNHTEKDDAVYDPFVGSGTAIIAAKRTGRVSAGIELDPRYCDVIVARWEAFTGNKAEKADG
jgi:DNA modification methylase